MLNLLALITIFCTGCSTNPVLPPINSRSLASISDDFSESEFALNQCLQNSREICFEKYPYGSLAQRWLENDVDFQKRVKDSTDAFDYCLTSESISCAQKNGDNQLEAQIIENQNSLKVSGESLSQFDWFFLSPSKIKNVISFIKKLNTVKHKIISGVKQTSAKGKKITLELLHGQGVGINGNYFAGEGRSFSAEALILNKELTLYCSSGISYQADIGANIGASKVFALGCKDRSHYQGGFLTLIGGISAEAVGVPLSYDLAYSFGFDNNQFIEKLSQEARKNRFYKNKVIPEILVLKQVLDRELQYSKLTELQKIALKLAVKLGFETSASKNEDVDLKSFINKNNISKLLINKNISLGQLAKIGLTSNEIQIILIKYKLKNLKVLFSAISESLNGCDSVSGALSISLSLNPVDLGVALTHYESLFTVNMEKVLSLKNITGLVLLNPILMDKYTILKIIELAQILETLSMDASKKCLSESYYKTIKNFSLINSL